jgi:tripartite motif-containing protein 9/67
LLSAKKVGAEGEVIEYGYDSRVGDVIGVLLEYKSEVASLSFYRNGVIRLMLSSIL